MRHSCRRSAPQRFLPGRERLSRESSNQIDDSDSRFLPPAAVSGPPAQSPALCRRPLTCASRSMNDCTPRLTRFTPACGEGLQRSIRNLARRALHRDLRIGFDSKFRCVSPRKSRAISSGSSKTRCSPAQIDRVHRRRHGRRFSLPFRRPTIRNSQSEISRVNITCMFARRIDSRSKIAISALRAAKRNRNIEPELSRCAAAILEFFHACGHAAG